VSISGDGISSGNLPIRPHVPFTEGMDWVTLMYDANNARFGSSTAGGVVEWGSPTDVIPSKWNDLASIRVGGVAAEVKVDEVIMFNRVLDPKEIASITHINHLDKNK